jgi:hypothetical protein
MSVKKVVRAEDRRKSEGEKFADTLEVNGQTEIEVERITPIEKEKKVQKVSISYTLKSFANNNVKLREAGIISEETYQKLIEIKNSAVNAWTQTEF